MRFLSLYFYQGNSQGLLWNTKRGFSQLIAERRKERHASMKNLCFTKIIKGIFLVLIGISALDSLAIAVTGTSSTATGAAGYNYFYTGTPWSDGNPPNDTNDYTITSMPTPSTNRDEQVFHSKTLTMTGNGTLGLQGMTGSTLRFPDLTFKGSMRYRNNSMTTNVIRGKVTFSGDSRLQATYTPKGRYGYRFEAETAAAASTTLSLAAYWRGSTTPPEFAAPITAIFVGSAANFKGTVNAQTNDMWVVLSSGDFAGNVKLSKPGTRLATGGTGRVEPVKTVTVNSSEAALEIAAGDTLQIETLAYTGKLHVILDELDKRPNVAVPDRAVLTAPRGSFSPETLNVTDSNGAALPDWATVRVADEGEVTKLVLHRKEIITLTTVRSGAAGSPFMEANKDCWSDGELPHPGADYLIDKSSWFYLPNDDEPYTFLGDLLTMEKGATANIGNDGIPAFICRNLRVDNAVFRTWGHDFALGGGTITLDGKVTFLHYNGRTSVFSVDSELVGSGDATCDSYVSVNESGSCGQIALTALNTNFTGKIKVTMPNGTKDYGEVPSLTRSTTLHVNDPRNLGGALATFTPDALQLEQMSILRPAATMTLDTPNRGIRVSGMGRFDVPRGITLTVANPITYAGTLRKEGAGTLVLAAAPIIEPSAGAPTGQGVPSVDGGNRLEIAEGRVVALATNALDGVAVATGEKGALAFGINPSGEGMREYGLMGVGGSVGEGADATMDDATGGDATINVAFDVSSNPEAPPEDNWTVALFTVSSDAAEALKDRLRVTKAYLRYAVDLSVRENGDGTATILATHVRRAYTIDAATCETALPLFRGDGEVTVPRGVHLDFTGFGENGFIDRPFTIARGGSLALPPGFEDWTFAPAVEGYGLVLDVVDDALIATVKKGETAHVGPKGNLVFSGLGDGYPFYMNMTVTNGAGSTVGTYRADGDVYAYGDRSFAFTNVTGVAGEVFDGNVEVSQLDYRTVRATWSFTPNVDIRRVKVVGVNLTFPTAEFDGGRLRLGNKDYEITSSGKIASATVDEIELIDKNGVSRLTLKLDRMRLVYANGGATSGSMKIYHYNTDEPEGYFVADQTRTISFDLSAPAPVKAEGNWIEIISQDDGGWVPVTAYEYVKQGSPLDFTDVCGTGKPAGKYGRVKRVGDHFEFTNLPGIPQRFHGLTSGAAAYSYADEPMRDTGLADLSRRGYNATRIHGYEPTVLDPDEPSQTTLGEEQMRLFDGYVAASISNGLYIILELYGNERTPSWRSIGVNADGAVARDEAKMLLSFHEGMISNQMVFLRNYLTHVNRYTGRSFIDEPAIIGADLVNEAEIWVSRVTDNAYMSETAQRLFLEAWGRYVTAKKETDPVKYASVDAATIPAVSSGTVSGRLFVQFIRENYLDADRQMKAFLRDELDFRGVLTDSTHHSLAACIPVKMDVSDYHDNHFYEDHPGFLEAQFALPSTFGNKNQNPLNGTLASLRRGRGIPGALGYTFYGYPFVMTEFNYVAPSQFRFAGGLLMGSAAALQDADGLWQHSYYFNAARNALGWFNYISDPLMPAWSRAILTLFARGDMRPLAQTYVTRLDPAAMCSDDEPAKSAAKLDDIPHTWAAWYRKTGLLVADEDAVPPGVTLSGDWAARLAKTEADVMADLGIARDANGKLPVAGDGQVKIDDVDGSIMVNTERTAGGFAEKGVIAGGALRAEIGNVPTAIWVSTLGDGQSIADSKRLLLTHLTDVQDEGLTYLEKTRQTQLTWGKLPHLMRRGVAEVELTVGPGAYFVYALSGDGERRFTVPSTKVGNTLRFTADIGADPSEATYLYEIVRRTGVFLKYR